LNVTATIAYEDNYRNVTVRIMTYKMYLRVNNNNNNNNNNNYNNNSCVNH